jgi:large subunit ribosomal protein L25
MSSESLTAKKRHDIGKGAARKARAAGHIPGVLYGPGEEPQPLQVSVPDFMKIYHGGHGENVLVDLTIDSDEPKTVLFREVQRDPVSEEVLHVDFYHVSLTTLIKVHVPVRLNGIPDGVKNAGGILQHVMREVEIECFPADIPDHLSIEVSELAIHDAVHISDLPATNWKLMDDPSRTVASVIPPVVSQEPEPAEGEEVEADAEAEAVAEGEEATEPERIGEKEAEGEAKAEGKKKESKSK